MSDIHMVDEQKVTFCKVEQRSTEKPVTTTNPSRVTCKQCKEIIDWISLR